MRHPIAAITLAFALFGLIGCGATVGDPCTTPSDCGGQLCINKSHTPGGYCSRQCVIGDPEGCPSGTLCIPDGAAKDVNACYVRCESDRECRPGYVCRSVKDQPRVCIGPDGL